MMKTPRKCCPFYHTRAIEVFPKVYIVDFIQNDLYYYMKFFIEFKNEEKYNVCLPRMKQKS